MQIVVTKERRGEGLKLNFAVIYKRDAAQITSDVYNINDNVNLRFKFLFVHYSNIKLFISFKKHELAKDSSVNVEVKSEVLSYAKCWTCTENWVDWQEMGSKSYQAELSNLYMVLIPINITLIIGKSFIAENIFEDSDWTDFILTAIDGSVAVHKACLAALSDVFKRMLAREWKETTEGRIQIEGVTLQTLKFLKQYMYLGTVPDNEDELRPLLLIANCYMIDNLKSVCISKLARLATPEKLEDLLNFAVDNKMTDLILAMIQLTPDKVVHGAFEIKAKGPTVEQQIDEVKE